MIFYVNAKYVDLFCILLHYLLCKFTVNCIENKQVINGKFITVKLIEIYCKSYYTKYILKKWLQHCNKFLRIYITNHLSLTLNYRVCVAICCKH